MEDQLGILIKSVVEVGFPAAVALYLLKFLIQRLLKRLDKIEEKIDKFLGR